METRKLISLKDYVLNYNPTKEQIVSYAKFLNEPLKLSFFVPCDKEGNVLEDIHKVKEKLNIWHPNHIVKYAGKEVTLAWYESEYNRAKNRVLFEGFECKKGKLEGLLNIYKDKCFLNHFNIEKNEMLLYSGNTIEALTHYDITLTPTAIKQLGL